MNEFEKLPPEDFMYDRVDFNFLVEINMVIHFITLAHNRIEEDKSNHKICEVFIIFKNLVEHLSSLSSKIVCTEESQSDLDQIFKKTRKGLEMALKQEIEKKMREDKGEVEIAPKKASK